MEFRKLRIVLLIDAQNPHLLVYLTKPSLGFIGSAHKILTSEEALIKLQTQPLGAAIPIFQPDYNQIKGAWPPSSSRPALRGPMYKDSVFRGMHAVSVTGSGVENGESFLWVRSSHGTDLGQDGYFRVSIDVMILRTSKCQDHEERYFKKPTPLLERFCYPDFPRF
ncbi:hypothetical protein IGI04_029703 [Brassica rapa subsp. trilocularis]|uniref:Peptidase C1A papain C-terminal domain-containing protein n=1 Tax=Brassica rapa subsp. trilocularis TaxID=1813537 RepID=A0ABQ7LNP8_BRACM|nr:hypothetical protein IGI04_029703 [Brassica rapa subsp. trilocularis]